MNKIKSSSRVAESTNPDTGEITASVKAELGSNKLKSMLAGIKAKNS